MIPFLVKRAVRSIRSKEDENDLVLIHPELAQKTNVYERLQEECLFIGKKQIKDLTVYSSEYYQKLYVWNKSGVANTNLSLRYGLWDRDPTNDIRVIQYCLSIPKEQYVTAGRNRSLIRRAMEGRLPDSIIWNHVRRGLQSADIIERMKKDWQRFIEELQDLCQDPVATEWMNKHTIQQALHHVGKSPKHEVMFSKSFKMLTRALIVYRFLKKVYG